MPDHLQGSYDASDASFAVVVSRFNSLITEKLLEGALDTLERHGANLDRVTVAWCPGALEIPQVARRLAASGAYDAVVCLGAVIRGATPHFDIVAEHSARGSADVARDTGVPVIFGVLTTDTVEQALERAGTKAGNKGADAATAAVEMASLFQQI